MCLTVRALNNIGAEVSGFDINGVYSDELQAELKKLWYEYAVLLFRGQDITPESQIRFSRIFGELAMHPLKVNTSAEYPELFVLQTDAAKAPMSTARYHGVDLVGKLDWHLDLHYTGRPNHGALLTAVEVPAEGGMTGFGDLAKAYDALDDDTQTLLQRLQVVYAFSMQRRHMRYVDLDGYEPGPGLPKKPSDVGFPDFSDVVYPAVMTHPVSGRKVLGIVEQFLERIVTPQHFGLCNDEAIELLERIVAHIKRPEFHYFHQWRKGDMVLWDNWRAMHCATGVKPGVRRMIHRTTIAGGRALVGQVL